MEAPPPPTPAAPIAVAFPTSAALSERVRRERPPRNLVRRLSSVFAGAGALMLTGKTVVVFVADPLAALGIGLVAAGFWRLTWRWARGEPPATAFGTADDRAHSD
jgi:hypothetical protein